MKFWHPILARVIVLLASVQFVAAGSVTVFDPGFDAIGGKLDGVLDLNVFDGPPGMLKGRLGSSPWYGWADVTVSGQTGYRGGVEVNDSLSAGVGALNYSGTLGGLLGADVPATYLWQPLAGTSLVANCTYTLALDVNIGSLLSLSLLSSNGFGVGITTGSSSSAFGSFYTQSTTSPTSISLSLLGGTTDRLTYQFTSGASVPAGDIGVVIYAGYGTQAITLDLGTTYRIDNVSLAMNAVAVPEPTAAWLFSLGLLPAAFRRFARTGNRLRCP